MSLDAFCVTFAGRACRHVPDGSPFDVLDPSFATIADDNRWHVRGEPRLYLAGDHDVLAVEWARHFPSTARASVRSQARARRIYDLTVLLDAVLDLRDSRLAVAIGRPGTSGDFLAEERCRSTATQLRRSSSAGALLVPSIGMLDRTDRWVMVLSVDKLASFPGPSLTEVAIGGTFRVVEQSST